jgi:hypothetical protein
MKGIELPINILVIVAVAIIVLLGVIALFYSSWFPVTQPVNIESVKSQMCSSANRMGCVEAAVGLKTNYQGKDLSLGGDRTALDGGSICGTYYQVPDDEWRTCLTNVCGMNCGTGPTTAA